jgi:dethiobiotin synthetase
MTGFFIAGTDTDVGKTFFATVLLAAMRRMGFTAVGMKPVAAGCEHVDAAWVNLDVSALLAASSISMPVKIVNPYLFREAIAPHIAAEHKGTKIEIPVIVDAYQALAKAADIVLVEGAGGLLVPIDACRDMADVAVALGLPVILVVGMRLGCINHALLTRLALAERGLQLAAWVANQVDPDMLAYEENLATLSKRLDAPLLAELPFMERPDPELAAGYVSGPRLHALLAE